MLFAILSCACPRCWSSWCTALVDTALHNCSPNVTNVCISQADHVASTCWIAISVLPRALIPLCRNILLRCNRFASLTQHLHIHLAKHIAPIVLDVGKLYVRNAQRY